MILPVEALLAGETALDNAPKTKLADGRLCVPQHYLSYKHTLQSVEALIVDIDYDPRFPIFVSTEGTALYIQVGIIGMDNYPENSNTEPKSKIVYGRKWRVEPQLPSSEIIQTAFLALKKAREHEVRELFRLQHNDKTTTPFNNHHDLPLLARNEQRLQQTDDRNTNNSTREIPVAKFNQQLEYVLGRLNYDGQEFELMSLLRRPSGQYLIELIVKPNHDAQLNEKGTSNPQADTSKIQADFISFLLTELNINQFLQRLMQQFIDLSDRHVDENFHYRGFTRFSWNNSVEAISEISAEVRQLHKDESSKHFQQHWQKSNYETDRSRIPNPAPGDLWDKIYLQLKQFSTLEHFPNIGELTE